MGLFKPSYHELCKKGIRAFDSHNLEKAKHFFVRAIEMDATQPRAFGWLGMMYQDAMDPFSLDAAKLQELGEFAVKAFDEAIRREDDIEMKAEFWRQRGVVLGGMGRPDEQAVSWAEADKLIPGFVERATQQLMDEVVRDFGKNHPQP